MEEFLAEYSSMLRALTRNEKNPINTLSMLAETNPAYAEGIVGSIEQHILTCPPPAKLPALYLVDSIIKNVGEPFKSKFAERLPQVFGAVWDTTLQDKRSSLSRLFGTWTGVLPAHVLARVADRMVSSSNGRQAAPAQVAVLPIQQLQQPIQQPQLVQHAVPLQAPYFIPHAQQQPLFGLSQQSTTFVNIGGNLVPVLQPGQQAPLLQPMAALHPQQQQHNTPQHVMQAYGLPPVSPAHPSGWQPQQQQQVVLGGAGPMVRRSPGSPNSAAAVQDAMRGPPPPPAAVRAATRKSASPMPNSAELTSDALTKLLSNLANTGVLASAKSEAAALKVTEFQPAFIKEMHPGVLQLLGELSAKSRPKFRDVEYQRNKRKSAAAGGSVSRTWYLTVDTWIAGTTATGEAVTTNNPFEDDEAAAGSEQEEAPPAEPEDPDQPCCAISGEPFDKFFDQDSEGWFYRGARRIIGEEAARYGVPDGSLVKVKCLAEAGLGSGAAAMLAAGGGGGGDKEQQQEALMAAAAADAPAAGQAGAAAAAAAASGGAEDAGAGSSRQQAEGLAEDQQLHAAVAVKQEVVHDENFKQEGWHDSKPEPETTAAAAAAAAGSPPTGSKREASDAAGEQEGLNSAAKRAKLEQTA